MRTCNAYKYVSRASRGVVNPLICEIPKGGAMIVFNGNIATWRARCTYFGGLSVHVLDNKDRARVRDFIITDNT